MQQNIENFIVEPNKLDEIFIDFKNKSPFNLKRSIKDMMKDFKIKENEFYYHLSLELMTAYKKVREKNYIYHNGNYFKIAIIKFRMQDEISNSGKSNGWRIVALVDEINKIFYLLDVYKHSKGKDDLTPDENKKVRMLCDEYAESI